MDAGDMNENMRLAGAAFDEERDHSGGFSSVPDPGRAGSFFEASQLDILKKRHHFLNEYSNEALLRTPIETLLKLEATSIKLKNLEKGKDVEEKLAGNRESLLENELHIKPGKDNRWSLIHESRFLPGAACSAAKLWLRGREVLGTGGHPAVAVYDMASVGLAGHVTPRGWLALGDPGDSSISINMFSISNCGKKGIVKADMAAGGELKEIAELGELKVAMRALREALSFSQPWNKSVSALEGFLLQSNFCSGDLDGVEGQAGILTNFVDYVLRENSNRWRGQEPFLSIIDTKGAWESFLGSRPQAVLAKTRKSLSFGSQGARSFYKSFQHQPPPPPPWRSE